MTGGSNSRRKSAFRFAAVLFATALFGLGVVTGSVAAQPDCATITYAEHPDSLGIQTVEQLQCVASNPTADYTLRRDIDASKTEGWNNGTGFEPVKEFRGTFDGNGYAVRDLTIDRADQSEVGLFASTGSGALVTNVELRNADVTGNEYVGTLVGRNNGEVSDSHVSGDVTGERNVGGLVGFNRGGIVVRSSSTANVTANTRNAGGLVGRNSGEVNASYTDAAVEGDTAMGGVVGYNLGKVRNSYSTSKVSGRVIAGGIVGENRGDSVVSTSYSAGSVRALSEVKGVVGLNTGNVVTSYFDTESVRGRGSPGGEVIGVGLSTDEMTGEDAGRAMEELDFEGTWVTTDSYPVLAWQMEGGDGTGDETDDGTTDDEDRTDDGTDEDTDDETDGDTDTEGDADGGTDDGTGSEDGTDGETEDAADDGTEGGEGMPGFGFLAGVAALLGALLLVRRFVSD